MGRILRIDRRAAALAAGAILVATWGCVSARPWSVYIGTLQLRTAYRPVAVPVLSGDRQQLGEELELSLHRFDRLDVWARGAEDAEEIEVALAEPRWTRMGLFGLPEPHLTVVLADDEPQEWSSPFVDWSRAADTYVVTHASHRMMRRVVLRAIEEVAEAQGIPVSERDMPQLFESEEYQSKIRTVVPKLLTATYRRIAIQDHLRSSSHYPSTPTSLPRWLARLGTLAFSPPAEKAERRRRFFASRNPARPSPSLHELLVACSNRRFDEPLVIEEWGEQDALWLRLDVEVEVAWGMGEAFEVPASETKDTAPPHCQLLADFLFEVVDADALARLIWHREDPGAPAARDDDGEPRFPGDPELPKLWQRFLAVPQMARESGPPPIRPACES